MGRSPTDCLATVRKVAVLAVELDLVLEEVLDLVVSGQTTDIHKQSPHHTTGIADHLHKSAEARC